MQRTGGRPGRDCDCAWRRWPGPRGCCVFGRMRIYFSSKNHRLCVYGIVGRACRVYMYVRGRREGGPDGHAGRNEASDQIIVNTQSARIPVPEHPDALALVHPELDVRTRAEGGESSDGDALLLAVPHLGMARYVFGVNVWGAREGGRGRETWMAVGVRVYVWCPPVVWRREI